MEFKVGDEVIMKGRVVGITDSVIYPVLVLFEGFPNSGSNNFTKDGKFRSTYPSPSLFHAQPTERLVEVRDNELHSWSTRVFCKEVDGSFFCWSDVKSLERAKCSTKLTSWKYMREIPPKKKITIAEIAEKFGVSVDEIEIEE
jgi:hypothetical protein